MTALLLLSSLLAAPPGQMYAVRQGELSYAVVHKLHEVKGTTHAVEGRALVQPDGAARVQVRAKVASFDSGNSNRDVHMREVTHEAEHPWASIKGTIAGIPQPFAAADVTLKATVELNGQKQTVDVPVHLAPEGEGLRATFSFPTSLEAFHVERPELLLVKVDDKMVISGSLLFEAEK